MALLGSRYPRFDVTPPGDTTMGVQAVEFCRWAGMTLFEWQEDMLRDSLRTIDAPGSTRGYDYAAREVVAIIPRQNGKGEYLVARELVAIYLLGTKTILHTAHNTDTALDAMKRLWEVIESNPNLMYWWEDEHDTLPRMVTGNGMQHIKFPNGAEVHFRTRSHKTGRGLSVELLVVDEAFNLPNQFDSALSKLTTAQELAQKIYISSPVDQNEHPHGRVFSAMRWAGVDGETDALFREWSPPEDADPFQMETWAMANPSLVDVGVGAQLREIRAEARKAAKDDELLASFWVENLGLGNWFPRSSEKAGKFVPLIDYNEWDAHRIAPPAAAETGLSCLAVDDDPQGEGASLVSATQYGDKVFLSVSDLAVFERDPIMEELVWAVGAVDPVAVVLDPSGRCNTLVGPLARHGIEATQVNGAQVSRYWLLFLQMVEEGRIKHDGNPRFLAALQKAKERSRNGSYRSLDRYVGDVSVLVAATLAVGGLDTATNVSTREYEVEKPVIIENAHDGFGVVKAMPAVRRAPVGAGRWG